MQSDITWHYIPSITYHPTWHYMQSIIMAHPARYNLISHDTPFHMTYHDLQHEMSHDIPSQMVSHAIHDIPSHMTLNVIHHHGTSRKTQQSKIQNLLHTGKQNHAGNQTEISHRRNNCTNVWSDHTTIFKQIWHHMHSTCHHMQSNITWYAIPHDISWPPTWHVTWYTIPHDITC